MLSIAMRRLDKKELESFDVHSVSGILGVSLWVLEYLSDESESRFGSTKIAQYIVDQLGISTSKQTVHMALSKAVKDKLCHKEKGGFKLMKSGQDELLKQMNQDRIVLLEPGKPFSAGVELSQIFAQMSGVVRLSEPYVDDKTLDLIYRHFADKELAARILTSQIADRKRFERDLKKMQAENIDIEVRRISGNVLHDRYFIDDKRFWLSGNSLNNLGSKESFIVMLSDGIRQSMLQTFNARWASASIV